MAGGRQARQRAGWKGLHFRDVRGLSEGIQAMETTLLDDVFSFLEELLRTAIRFLS
jgi:hypothetical protein